MLTRPFEYPVVKKEIPEPPPVEMIDVTIVEIALPSGVVSVVLTDEDSYEDSYEFAVDAVRINLKKNDRIGRPDDEEVLYFRSHVYYISQRNTRIEVRSELFTPPAAVPGAADPQ